MSKTPADIRQRHFRGVHLVQFALTCESFTRKIHRPISLLTSSVTVGNASAWAYMSMDFSLQNGGTAGAIWMFVIVAFLMFFVVLVSHEVNELRCAVQLRLDIVHGRDGRHGSHSRWTVS